MIGCYLCMWASNLDWPGLPVFCQHPHSLVTDLPRFSCGLLTHVSEDIGGWRQGKKHRTPIVMSMNRRQWPLHYFSDSSVRVIVSTQCFKDLVSHSFSQFSTDSHWYILSRIRAWRCHLRRCGLVPRQRLSTAVTGFVRITLSSNTVSVPSSRTCYCPDCSYRYESVKRCRPWPKHKPVGFRQKGF